MKLLKKKERNLSKFFCNSSLSNGKCDSFFSNRDFKTRF